MEHQTRVERGYRWGNRYRYNWFCSCAAFGFNCSRKSVAERQAQRHEQSPETWWKGW